MVHKKTGDDIYCGGNARIPHLHLGGDPRTIVKIHNECAKLGIRDPREFKCDKWGKVTCPECLEGYAERLKRP